MPYYVISRKGKTLNEGNGILKDEIASRHNQIASSKGKLLDDDTVVKGGKDGADCTVVEFLGIKPPKPPKTKPNKGKGKGKPPKTPKPNSGSGGQPPQPPSDIRFTHMGGYDDQLTARVVGGVSVDHTGRVEHIHSKSEGSNEESTYSKWWLGVALLALLVFIGWFMWNFTPKTSTPAPTTPVVQQVKAPAPAPKPVVKAKKKAVKTTCQTLGGPYKCLATQKRAGFSKADGILICEAAGC